MRRRRSHVIVLFTAFAALTCVFAIGGMKQAAPSVSPASTAPATQPTTRSATQPEAETQEPKLLRPFENVLVVIDRAQPDRSRVEIQGFTCLDSGWLEQVACGPASREHESLVVIKPKPSEIHAALLLGGFVPGKPGRWTYEDNKLGAINPTGERVAISVRYADKASKVNEHGIARWIRSPASEKAESKPFPHEPFVFGGSAFVKNSQDMGPGEHYVADMTGSIIGLVTFGDEMIGFSRVMSDQESLQEPTWEVNTDTIPPVETPVTIIIKKWVNK